MFTIRLQEEDMEWLPILQEKIVKINPKAINPVQRENINITHKPFKF